jgi:hypothetical protein
MPTTDPAEGRKGDQAEPSALEEPNLADFRTKILLDIETLREMVAEANAAKKAHGPGGVPPAGRPS